MDRVTIKSVRIVQETEMPGGIESRGAVTILDLTSLGMIGGMIGTGDDMTGATGETSGTEVLKGTVSGARLGGGMKTLLGEP